MRSIIKSLISIGATLFVAFQPAWAYFSDSVSSETQFKATDAISVQVIEDRWNSSFPDEAGVPDASSHLVSKQVVEKNPCVKNTSPIDVWALLSVRIPKEVVALVDENTQSVLYPQEASELFTYSVSRESGWLELEELDDFSSDTYNTYVYLYSEPLAPQECSTTLFDSVVSQNLLAGTCEGVKDITVEATAVQQKGLSEYEDARDYFVSTKAYEGDA